MKLYQLIWILAKNWRDWNKEIDATGLFRGLMYLDVKPKHEDWLRILPDSSVESIVLHLSKQIERNQRFAGISPFEKESQFKNGPGAILLHATEDGGLENRYTGEFTPGIFPDLTPKDDFVVKLDAYEEKLKKVFAKSPVESQDATVTVAGVEWLQSAKPIEKKKKRITKRVTKKVAKKAAKKRKK